MTLAQLSKTSLVDEEAEIVVDEAPTVRRNVQKGLPESRRASVAIVHRADFMVTQSIRLFKPWRIIFPVIQAGAKRLDPDAELALNIGAKRVRECFLADDQYVLHAT